VAWAGWSLESRRTNYGVSEPSPLHPLNRPLSQDVRIDAGDYRCLVLQPSAIGSIKRAIIVRVASSETSLRNHQSLLSHIDSIGGPSQSFCFRISCRYYLHRHVESDFRIRTSFSYHARNTNLRPPIRQQEGNMKL
jgi:hypothetical protein